MSNHAAFPVTENISLFEKNCPAYLTACPVCNATNSPIRANNGPGSSREFEMRSQHTEKMDTQTNTSSYDANSLETAQTHLAAIQSQLPARRALTPKQRQALAIVGDKNLAFVSQAVELCVANPEILPRAIDVAETTQKADAHTRLLRLEARIEQTLEAVRDVRIQLGNELYALCLTVYELTGRAHLGAGMKSGRATLERRFKKTKPISSETPPPEVAS